MARRKTNKPQKIREAFAELGEVGPSVVVKHLAEQRIKVSSAQVSTVKARMGGSKSDRNGHSSTSISLRALLEAKHLVREAGSIDAARQSLVALAKLV